MSYLVTFIFYIENNIKSFHIRSSTTKYWDLFFYPSHKWPNVFVVCCSIEYLLETKQNKYNFFFALSFLSSVYVFFVILYAPIIIEKVFFLICSLSGL